MLSTRLPSHLSEQQQQSFVACSHVYCHQAGTMCVRAEIEWPEDDDEALSDNARSTIEALLSSDPQDRPDALGPTHFLLSYS